MKLDFKKEVLKFIRELGADVGINVTVSEGDHLNDEILFGKAHLSIRFHSHKDDFTGVEKIGDPEKREDQVVHLWEDQWVYHNAKVLSKLRSLLGLTKRIHARETQVVKIDNVTLVDFLNSHHLNVPIKGKYKYALNYNSELVAVISLSKGRPILRDGQPFQSYELLRFCNKLDITVVGGFSKMLSHFTKIHHPDDIMSYVDADWSNGKSLSKIGFNYVGYKKAEEFWLNGATGKREYPHLVMQENAELLTIPQKKLKAALMARGFYSVHNSGSYKFLLKMK